MADYHPLLARALKALPDPNDATRRAVYDRARQALLGQLRSLEPPLSEGDIEQERVALDAAIDRLEDEYAPQARREPAGLAPQPVVAPTPRSPAPAPAPIAPAPPPMAAPIPAQEPEPVRPAPAVEAPPPPEASPEPEPAAAEPPPLHAHRFDRDALPEPNPPSAPPVIVPARPRSRASAPTQSMAEGGEPEIAAGRSQRPRIETRAPSGGRPRLLRNMAVALVLLIVIGLIAAAAWALRDKPSDLATLSPEAATGQQPGESEAQKFADRVGGERAPAIAGPARPAAAPSPAAAGVSVAQRATLYEENTANPQSPPKQTAGRVVWRLDAVNGGQGQPLETVVRANIEIPEANGLTVALTIRRNLDATLPASHTIEVAFTNTGTEPNRTARDVALLQTKEEENGRGPPLVGLPVPVRDNLFLLGLSNLPSDIERNTDLLQTRNWIDLPIRYASGGRAVITFEKGTPGERVLRDAFAQWSGGR